MRPEPVLKQALALVKIKWEERSAEYIYLCSQLKAIRQDLTVQHICNGKREAVILYSITKCDVHV